MKNNTHFLNHFLCSFFIRFKLWVGFNGEYGNTIQVLGNPTYQSKSKGLIQLLHKHRMQLSYSTWLLHRYEMATTQVWSAYTGMKCLHGYEVPIGNNFYSLAIVALLG